MLATGSDRRLFGIPQSITDDCVKTTSITCYMRQDRACASLANVDCMVSPPCGSETLAQGVERSGHGSDLSWRERLGSQAGHDSAGAASQTQPNNGTA